MSAVRVDVLANRLSLLLLSEFPDHGSVVEMPGQQCRKN